MIHSEERPWGGFVKFHENKLSTVKIIHINPNSRLSLQYHEHRSEFWQVIKGTAIVEIDGKKMILKEDDTVTIPKLAKHRLGAGKDPCTIIEISYGRFDENDIIRLEDDYGRMPMIDVPTGQFARTSAA